MRAQKSEPKPKDQPKMKEKDYVPSEPFLSSDPRTSASSSASASASASASVASTTAISSDSGDRNRPKPFLHSTPTQLSGKNWVVVHWKDNRYLCHFLVGYCSKDWYIVCLISVCTMWTCSALQSSVRHFLQICTYRFTSYSHHSVFSCGHATL